MTGLCPSCGYNILRDEPIHRGDWTLEPISTWFRGIRLALSPTEAGFLHSLAKAGGRPLSREVMGVRLSDSEDPANIMCVYAARLRRKLDQVPFETVRGSGYRWAA